jgi:two-component system sensor histidine kinase FlrB
MNTSPVTSSRESASDLADTFELFITASKALERRHEELAAQIDALNADLVRAHDQLQSLINVLPAGVVLVESGRVTHFNSAALRWLPELEKEGSWALPESWKPGAGPSEYQVHIGGQSHTVQIEHKRQGMQMVIQIQDITENLRRLGEAERIDRLAAMGKMSAGIAHQFRTPLSTAMLYASYLVDAQLDETQRADFARRVHTQLLNLEKLAGQMLQFIKPVLQQPELVSPNDLTADALTQVEALARQRSIRICYDENAHLDGLISCERASLVSALVAVLENAIEVSAAGDDIAIGLRRQGMRVDIGIEDSGPGIAADMLDSLFEPFSTSRSNGTGLGLSIALDTVRKHRGEIHAENRQPRGARFLIQLPCMARL